MKKLFFLLSVLVSFFSQANDFDWRARSYEETGLLQQASYSLNAKEAPFNAVGNGVADDYAALQWAIDSAIKSYLPLDIPPGRYKTSQTLIGARWNAAANAYAQAFIRINGADAMHSPGVTKIEPNFKDGPALALHLNKGSIIRGLFFDGDWKNPAISLDSFFRADLQTYGDTTCRDSPNSPFCAIVIDPFRGVLPPDSGYPRLRSWYRGPDNVSGSTGVRIEDCTFRNFTIGAILSPNGKTLNNELITFENIRLNDCKIGFVGCQAQEKQNRLINIEAWGRIKCIFAWGLYGAGQPGHYVIDQVNAAGQIGQVLHRPSQGFFPLFMTNFFGEGLYKFGYWNTSVGDAISNSSINFYDYHATKSFPDGHVIGSGVTYQNCTFRYYGQYTVPIMFRGNNTLVNSQATNYVKHIKGLRYNYTIPPAQQPDTTFTLTRISFGYHTPYWDGGIMKLRISQMLVPVQVGDKVSINNGHNYDLLGQGEVTAVDSTGYTVSYVSPNINNSIRTDILKYKSK